MAYANWLSPDKTSGNGNDTVNVSANSSNTGRNARSTTVTFKAADCEDVVRSVLQKGKPESSSIQDTAASKKDGQNVTISGTSNSSKLTFSLGVGALVLTLPTSYIANGVSVNNGANIAGDPGATAEYSFAITINVPENGSTEAQTRQIIATDATGAQHICTLTLAAGEAFLSVSPDSVEIPWDASESKSFRVESNTNWTIV